VKTDNGQFQFVNVAQPMPNTGATNVTIPQPTYRFQVPSTGVQSSVTSVVPTVSGGTTLRSVPGQQILTLPANSLQRTAVITTGAGGHMTSANMPGGIRAGSVSNAVSQPLTIQTTTSASAANSSTPSQMSPNTAKKKCKNFLSTLIRLASDQPEQVATNVKNLIQGLIDGNIQPEDFTVQLQRELNSSPQPCLVPFLKKSLPYLRHSLMIREMTIDGVKAPPHGTVQLPGQATLTPAGTQIQHIQISRQTAPAKATVPGGATVRLLNSGNLATMTQTSQGTVLATGRPAVTPKAIHKYQKHTGASGATITMTPANAPLATGTTLSSAISRSNLSAQKKREILTKSKSPAGAKDRREPPKKKEEKDAFSSSLRDDDDINDVAAMGGVNLMEEHQRILATNAEFVGAQIRSCKDEPFLASNPLQSKINQIARKYGLDEVSSEVISLVSHAAQERLKTLVEKLGIIAEHRIDNLKVTDERPLLSLF
jgi:transcription initiation factor TFIID subunit 4